MNAFIFILMCMEKNQYIISIHVSYFLYVKYNFIYIQMINYLLKGNSDKREHEVVAKKY